MIYSFPPSSIENWEISTWFIVFSNWSIFFENIWDSVKIYEFAIWVNFGVKEKIPLDVTMRWYPLNKVFDFGDSKSWNEWVTQIDKYFFTIMKNNTKWNNIFFFEVK